MRISEYFSVEEIERGKQFFKELSNVYLQCTNDKDKALFYLAVEIMKQLAYNDLAIEYVDLPDEIKEIATDFMNRLELRFTDLSRNPK